MDKVYTICGIDFFEEVTKEEFYSQLAGEIEENIEHGMLEEDISFEDYLQEAIDFLEEGKVYVVINEFHIKNN